MLQFQVHTLPQNTIHHDTSLDLFDIDENDYEHDFQHEDEDSFSMDLNANNTFSFHPVYQQSHQQRNLNQFLTSLQNPFGDPFHATNVTNIGGGHVLNSINENVELQFHRGHGPYLPAVVEEGAFYPFGQSQGRRLGLYPTPAYVPIPPVAAPAGPAAFISMPPAPGLAAGFSLAHPHSVNTNFVVPARQDNINHTKKSSISSKNTASPSLAMAEDPPKSGCSVCLSPNPRTLAILVPCKHPLCSGCLTSALNIVGEKDMECAVCKRSVEDFKLQSTPFADSKDMNPTTRASATRFREPNTPRRTSDESAITGNSSLEPLFSSPGFSNGQVDLDLDDVFEPEEIRASTPKHVQHDELTRKKTGDNVVLRIDNVPWVRLLVGSNATCLNYYLGYNTTSN